MAVSRKNKMACSSHSNTEAAMHRSASPLLVPDLVQYLTPPQNLDCAEYCYRITLDFLRIIEKEPKLQDIHKILTALLNTSGGILIVIPNEPCPPGTRRKWLLQLKRTLIRFVPEHIVEGYIQFLDFDQSTKLLVTKSPLVITYESHLYVRGLDGTKNVSYTDDISRILNQKTTKVNLDPFKDVRDVRYNSKVDIQNSNVVCAIREEATRDYKANLEDDDVRRTIFSFPNTPGGGCFVLGLKTERPDVQSRQVLGHVICEDAEPQIANFLTTYLANSTDGTSTLWAGGNQKPARGEDWDVRFIPVVGGPAAERRRLIVISFKQFDGGVFEHSPESYLVSEEGYITQMPFDMWEQDVSLPKTIPTHQEQKWDWAHICSMKKPMMLIPNRSTIIASQRGKQRYITKAIDYIEQEKTKKSTGIVASQWMTTLHTTVLLSRPKNQLLDMFVLNESGETELWTIVDEKARDLSAHWEYLHQSGRLTKRKFLYGQQNPLGMMLTNEHELKCRLYQLGVGEHKIQSQMSMVSPYLSIVTTGNYNAILMRGSEYFSLKSRIRSIILDENSKRLSAEQMEKLVSIGLDKFNIIEGPPGSGKSLLALYIAQKFRTGYIHRGETFTKALNFWDVKYPMQVQSPNDLHMYLRHLIDLEYVIINDIQSVQLPVDTWRLLFDYIATSHPKLIVFAESEYLSFIEENDRAVKETVETLQAFCSERNYHASMKTLREIHRNTQTVVSYIKSNFSDQDKYPEYSAITCSHTEEGDDVEFRKLTDVFSDEYPNSLVEFAKILTDPQKVIDNESPVYTPDEIAILVDTSEASADAEHLREIFKNMVDEQIAVHDAGTFPVKGYTIDTLDNFKGLDRKCSILVSSEDIQQSTRLTGRSLANPRYKSFVASRGLSRVVFVLTSEVDPDVAAQFKTDTSPRPDKNKSPTKRVSQADNSDSYRSKRTKPTQLHRPADHEFSQKKDRFNKFAFITIEPKGGYFKIPNMGIEMIIPRDSVDHATTLKISIRDSFKNFPQPAYKWSLFSPRVKIEPDDVRYKKPVYLIINHNIQMALSDFDGSFNPVMLHRDKEDAEWTIITSRPIHSGDQDTEKIHGFAICREKQAVLTSSAVIVAMTSNCEQCVCEFLDENSVTRRVMRMTVHVYADYQQHCGQLRVRTHVVHGINNREQDVETKEIERYGGHFVDSQTTYVDRSNQPLNIDIRVTADGNAHPPQQNYIDYDSLRLELDHMRDTWPHKSFTVPLVTDGAAAPARSVRIEATAEQCELGRVARIDETNDLASLIQKTPKPVSTALQFQVAVGNETEGAVGGVFGESPVYVSALEQKHDRLIVLLRDHMTQAEKDKVRRYMVIEEIRYNVTAGPSYIDHIMLNTFVDTGDIQEVIDKLSDIGALSEEMHRILRALLRE